MLFLVLLVLIGSVWLAGCRGTAFLGRGVGQFPAQGALQYGAELYIETPDSGSMFALQDKDLWVRVYDTSHALVLNDRLERRRAAMVEGTADWPTFDDLTVVIKEVGDPRSSDPYNAELVRSGPRTLFTLHYRYDEARQEFVRAP